VEERPAENWLAPAKERIMAKGQRSNREQKKPKQPKEKPPAAGSLSATQRTLGATSSGKKK
jgi:hypothetical protein